MASCRLLLAVESLVESLLPVNDHARFSLHKTSNKTRDNVTERSRAGHVESLVESVVESTKMYPL